MDIKTTNEETGNKQPEKKSVFERLSTIIAVFACIIGLVSMLMPLISEKKAIPVESLYWFLLALAAVIFPYIKEITFKDLKITIDKITEAKESLKDAAMLMDRIKEKIDPTRVELIHGYQIYLNSLSPKEKRQKIELLSMLYLQGMCFKISDIKNMLKEIGFYNGKIDDEFTDEYYECLCKFQKETGLNPDGIFGYQSYRNLMKLKIEKG